MLSVALPQNRAMPQPLSWFEIPALDFARARSFYEKLFGVELQEHIAGPNIMAVFPYDRTRGGLPTCPTTAAITRTV
jgi:predicted enzyme related to lactoylglutathione lyase